MPSKGASSVLARAIFSVLVLATTAQAGDMINGTNIYPLNLPVIDLEMGTYNTSDNMGWFEIDGPRVP
jgi:hypothetical protein